jgi:hypothetical protein
MRKEPGLGTPCNSLSCELFDTGGVVDNYIVRIYRREKDNPRFLVGLVEEVGLPGKKAFSNLDDLWEILNRQGRGADTLQQKKKNRQKGSRQE